jgi:hypothetical protein
MEIEHRQNKRWKMLRTLANKLDELEKDEGITITQITIVPIIKIGFDLNATISYRKIQPVAAESLKMTAPPHTDFGFTLNHRDECIWE